MAKPLRIEYPGAIYHLTARGNARQPIFLDDWDRSVFLALLGDIVERYNWHCHAYCLMGNHYHLLIETPDANLSIGMRQLGGIYTQKFNRLHSRVGHLFQGRYVSILIDRESYLLELCRYIVLNPVRAKMVTHPGDYPWSSFAATAGTVSRPQFLSIAWMLAQFDSDPHTAQHQYRDFVVAGMAEQSPWKKLQGQCLLGSQHFITNLLPHLEQKKGETEIPRKARYAARPPLSELFPAGQAQAERNRAIANAHWQYGYTQQEIAGQIGLHYSTVSRIVLRERNKSNNKT
jgi:putative transposase